MTKVIKKTMRCFKSRHRKNSHTNILSSLNAWDNPPIAPPYSN